MSQEGRVSRRGQVHTQVSSGKKQKAHIRTGNKARQQGASKGGGQTATGCGGTPGKGMDTAHTALSRKVFRGQGEHCQELMVTSPGRATIRTETSAPVHSETSTPCQVPRTTCFRNGPAAKPLFCCEPGPLPE